MQASLRIDVHRPVQEVWDFISRIENIDHWIQGLSDTQRTSDGDLAPGSTFVGNYLYDGKLHRVSYVVDEFDPPHRLAFRVTDGPHPAATLITLKAAAGSSTKISHTLDFGVSSASVGMVFLGLGPIARLSIMLKLRKELKSLKARLEGC